MAFPREKESNNSDRLSLKRKTFYLKEPVKMCMLSMGITSNI